MARAIKHTGMSHDALFFIQFVLSKELIESKLEFFVPLNPKGSFSIICKNNILTTIFWQCFLILVFMITDHTNEAPILLNMIVMMLIRSQISQFRMLEISLHILTADKFSILIRFKGMIFIKINW